MFRDNSYLQLRLAKIHKSQSTSKEIYTIEFKVYFKCIFLECKVNEFFFRFPLIDESETPYHEVCTLISAILGGLAVLWIISMNNLFIIISLNVKTQFQILQNIFKTTRFEESNLIKKLIIYHLTILDITKSLNDAFKYIFFFQTLLTAVQISLIMFQFLVHFKLENIFDAIPNFMYIIALLMDFFIYCYGGSSITEESLQLSFAIPQSEWFGISNSDKMLLKFMIARSQQWKYLHFYLWPRLILSSRYLSENVSFLV